MFVFDWMNQATGSAEASPSKWRLRLGREKARLKSAFRRASPASRLLSTVRPSPRPQFDSAAQVLGRRGSSPSRDRLRYRRRSPDSGWCAGELRHAGAGRGGPHPFGCSGTYFELVRRRGLLVVEDAEKQWNAMESSPQLVNPALNNRASDTMAAIVRERLLLAAPDSMHAGRTTAGWMNNSGSTFASVFDEGVLLANLSGEKITVEHEGQCRTLSPISIEFVPG